MFPPFKLYTNPKACHCETVRTLSWQSVLLKNVNIPRHRDADRHTRLIGHLLRDDSNPALPTSKTGGNGVFPPVFHFQLCSLMYRLTLFWMIFAVSSALRSPLKNGAASALTISKIFVFMPGMGLALSSRARKRSACSWERP